MKKIFQSIKSLFKYNLLTLLIFEIAYRTASFLIGIQGMRIVMDITLNFLGFSHLTAENYIRYIRQPLVWLCALILLVVLLLLMVVEISSLMVCYHYSREGKRIHVSDMFLIGLRQSFRMIRRNKLSWMAAMAFVFPVMNIQFLVREVSYIKILDYTATQIYKLIPNTAVLLVAGAAILLLSYLCIFALPYYILEERKVRRGLYQGMTINSLSRSRNFTTELLIQGAVTLALVLVYVLGMMLSVIYTKTTKPTSAVIPSLLIYSDWIAMGIGIVAGAVGTIMGTAFSYGVYALNCSSFTQLEEQRRRHMRLPGLTRVWRRRLAAALLGIIIVLEFGYIWFLAGERAQISESILTGAAITAHRGGAKKAPENTLSALAYAKEQRADYAEIDVQETKEGVVVLLHDSSLKRTTGVDKKIWEMNYFQIRKLDAGSHFRKDFAHERIPTLQQAIDFCGNELQLNVEIKYNGENQDIVRRVVKIFEKNDIVDTVILSSMNYNFLREAKELNPDIRTSYVMSMSYGSMADLIYADYVSIKSTYITKELVKETHATGKFIHAWTVNTQWGMERMHFYGVDNLITDDPALARQIFYGEDKEKLGFWELLKYVI